MTDDERESQLEPIFQKLGEIYEKLEGSFPKLDHNPCHGCNEHTVCCRADVISTHTVSALELAYLRKIYPDKDLEAFREFVQRKRDPLGNLAHLHCPFYSKSMNGCTVYQARPFSCRLFGPYFLESTGVPVYCGFKGIGKTFKRGEYFQMVPQARELAELKTLYYSRFPEKAGARAEGAETHHKVDEVELMESGDPLTRGKLLHNQGRLPEALAEYQKGRDEHSQSASYHFHLACLYQELGKDAEAVAGYNRVLELDPANPYVPIKLGLLHELAGRTREAIIAYRKALSLNPSNPVAHGNLGFLHLDRREFPEALDHLTKAATLDPSNGFYFLGLGSALAAFNRLPEARDALARSVQLHPMEMGYLLLASVTEQLGDLKEAARLRNEARKTKEPE